jgi:hypothetical protein
MNDHAGWNGLIFNGWSSNLEEFSVINYCAVEYSKISGITCLGYPKLQISNSDIRFNQTAGITLHEFSDIEMYSIHVHDNKGGGISCNSSAPIVYDFIIDNNQGSGISIYSNSMGTIPTFLSGKIMFNNSSNNGGGISLWDSGIDAANIEIISNSATNGGGVYCNMSSGEFRNITICDNIAENGAGIQSEFFSYLLFDHVLLTDNHANAIGGGAYIYESSVEFINSTISNNSANQGGGLYYNLYSFYENEIANSIIWNNEPDGIYAAIEIPEVNYSNIQGGIEGINNISEDPLFADPFNKDYHLQWSSFPNENGDKSPCIDAGDPASVNDPDGTIADMGAYYYNQVIYTTVNEKISNDKIIIYPNPMVNELFVKSAENINKIQVLNLMGQVEIEHLTTGLNIEIIDVSILNPGVHVINLYDAQGSVETKKIIKK